MRGERWNPPIFFGKTIEVLMNDGSFETDCIFWLIINANMRSILSNRHFTMQDLYSGTRRMLGVYIIYIYMYTVYVYILHIYIYIHIHTYTYPREQ